MPVDMVYVDVHRLLRERVDLTVLSPEDRARFSRIMLETLGYCQAELRRHSDGRQSNAFDGAVKSVEDGRRLVRALRADEVFKDLPFGVGTWHYEDYDEVLFATPPGS
jgi:hypothetical protein